MIIVKEQRVDGSSDSRSLVSVRCTLVAGKAGSWEKLSNPRLKFPLNCPILYKLNNKTYKLLWYEFKILH